MSDPISPEIFNHLLQLAALLTPTTAKTAFTICDAYGDSVLIPYADQLTVPANHAGGLCLSIRAGFDNNDLPIGAQLLGSDFSEALLLRIGRAFEIATAGEGWRKLKPEGSNII